MIHTINGFKVYTGKKPGIDIPYFYVESPRKKVCIMLETNSYLHLSSDVDRLTADEFANSVDCISEEIWKELLNPWLTNMEREFCMPNMPQYSYYNIGDYNPVRDKIAYMKSADCEYEIGEEVYAIFEFQFGIIKKRTFGKYLVELEDGRTIKCSADDLVSSDMKYPVLDGLRMVPIKWNMVFCPFLNGPFILPNHSPKKYIYLKLDACNIGVTPHIHVFRSELDMYNWKNAWAVKLFPIEEYPHERATAPIDQEEFEFVKSTIMRNIARINRSIEDYLGRSE